MSEPGIVEPYQMLPTEYLAAMGNLVVHWGYVESLTEIAIWAFLNVSREKGALLTTHMGMVSRLNALNTLAEKRLGKKDPEIVSGLADLLKSIDDLRVKRNDIIHAFYSYGPEDDPPKALKISARKGFKEQRIDVSTAQVKDITVQAHEAAGLLMEFLEFSFPKRRFPWPRVT